MTASHCRVKWAVLAVVAVAGAGCMEGYGTQGEVVLTPAEMTQSQRLTLMNEIGKRPYLDARRQFQLKETCELKVSSGSFFRGKNSTYLPLEESQVVKSFDRSDKTHDVVLVHRGEAQKVSWALLEGANWADAVQFFSLAQLLQRDCVTDSAEG